MSDTAPNHPAKAGSAVQVRLRAARSRKFPSRAVALRELLERALAELARGPGRPLSAGIPDGKGEGGRLSQALF